MDKRRFEIIYHFLILAYFFGDSEMLQYGWGRPSIFTIVVIDICFYLFNDGRFFYPMLSNREGVNRSSTTYKR